MTSDYTHYVMGRIVWGREVLSLWLEDKPGEEGGSVTPLVLQVYFWDHTGSFDNPNLDTRSVIMNYHLDFINGSTFRICSQVGYISITLPSYQ